ncbi:hypothetical protein V6N12_065976 [Hibiscus sabdariffa]|uniref:Remorin C-terminal domain-containing protein n=1 Tax=Hibiscus sabdariffa TaxID=183260 RepID=A0ABR2AN21_9ROSI
MQMEYEDRAPAWEEAEKSKHTARFWYDSKLYETMSCFIAKEEQMRAQAEAKMVKKIALAKHRSEEKRSATEARKNQDTERTFAQAKYICRTG